MKKLEKYINKSELILSLFLVFAVTFSVIISLTIANRHEELYEDMELSYVSNEEHKTLNFGNYSVRKYKYNRYNRGYIFQVKSGEDFYNNVIMKNEHFDSDLLFEVEGYIAFGYMWDEYNLFHYEVSDSFVVLGYVTITDEKVPAPFYGLHTEKEIEDEYNECKERNKERYAAMSQEEAEEEKQEFIDSYTKPRENFSFDEIKRIYNDSNSEYYSVSDDCILIKALVYNSDKGYIPTKNYYAKIVNVNGKARIFKIMEDEEFLLLEIQ